MYVLTNLCKRMSSVSYLSYAEYKRETKRDSKTETLFVRNENVSFVFDGLSFSLDRLSERHWVYIMFIYI